MFLGRINELNELNSMYAESGFRFVAIYGRRRVGKTALISEFCKGKDCIFHVAIEQNDRAALESFSRDVLRILPAARSMLDVFPSWEKGFEYIADQAGHRRMVVAIDEYPYLASANRSISSVLQKAIDTRLMNTNLFLILCGSSMSFMENQVLGYASPLYGRRTGQLKVEPFDYADSSLFFPRYTLENRLTAYGAVGGIPQYLQYLSQEDDLLAGLGRSYFRPTGHLFEEPSSLLKQELREPATYNSIIAAIASGASRLSEIATRTGEDSKKCAKYLKTMLDLRILKKEIPIGAKAERNSLYSVSDNMFRFWYRFVPENISNIQAGMGDIVMTRRVLPAIPDYMGRVFEDVCIQYMMRRNKSLSLPIMFDEIGRWWGNHPALKRQEEIDFIARTGDYAIFGECKWRTDPMGPGALDSLIAASWAFPGYRDRHYMLFSKSGFTQSLIDEAGRLGNVELVTLDQLFDV